jgi:hypothetical protein
MQAKPEKCVVIPGGDSGMVQMPMRTYFLAFLPLNILIALFPACVAAQTAGDAAEFHARVAALYSFEPHRLKPDEMDAKSNELDKFWDAAKQNPGKTLPLLRVELKNQQNSAFFAYDGSKLLLSLSNDAADQRLALQGLPRADLRGVQHTDYLRTVQWLAAKGYDTTVAAMRILDYPGFSAFIVQHALTLAQNYSLIYMLAPMEDSRYLTPLMARLDSEPDMESQKSVLLALWYTATPEATAKMERFRTDESKSKESRDYAGELLARKMSGVGSMSFSSVETLKEDRRKVMSRPISDEALAEFDHLTAKIIAKQQN